MEHQIGRWLMMGGVALLGIGAIYYFMGDKLHFIGRLPGDIRIEKENFRFYFPITTMILASIVFTLIIRLIQFLK